MFFLPHPDLLSHTMDFLLWKTVCYHLLDMHRFRCIPPFLYFPRPAALNLILHRIAASGIRLLPPAISVLLLPLPILKKFQGISDTARRCQQLHPGTEVQHMCRCVSQGEEPCSNTCAGRLSNGLRNAKTILI